MAGAIWCCRLNSDTTKMVGKITWTYCGFNSTAKLQNLEAAKQKQAKPSQIHVGKFTGSCGPVLSVARPTPSSFAVFILSENDDSAFICILCADALIFHCFKWQPTWVLLQTTCDFGSVTLLPNLFTALLTARSLWVTMTTVATWLQCCCGRTRNGSSLPRNTAEAS